MNAVTEKLADWRDGLIDLLPDTGPVKWVIAAVLAYLLVAVGLGMYWSLTPDHFDPGDKAAQYAAEDGGEVVIEWVLVWGHF